MRIIKLTVDCDSNDYSIYIDAEKIVGMQEAPCSRKTMGTKVILVDGKNCIVRNSIEETLEKWKKYMYE